MTYLQTCHLLCNVFIPLHATVFTTFTHFATVYYYLPWPHPYATLLASFDPNKCYFITHGPYSASLFWLNTLPQWPFFSMANAIFYFPFILVLELSAVAAFPTHYVTFTTHYSPYSQCCLVELFPAWAFYLPPCHALPAIPCYLMNPSCLPAQFLKVGTEPQ